MCGGWEGVVNAADSTGQVELSKEPSSSVVVVVVVGCLAWQG